MPGTNQKMAASRKRPMVPGAGCARMCTRRRPVCCVCSGTVCSIVLGCPFRFYCRAAHSAANGDRSGADSADPLSRSTSRRRSSHANAASSATAPTRCGSLQPLSASPGLTSSLVGDASGDASQREHSCAARTQRRRAPIGDAVWLRGTRRLRSAAKASRRGEGTVRCGPVAVCAAHCSSL